jgi:hypothetical protein
MDFTTQASLQNEYMIHRIYGFGCRCNSKLCLPRAPARLANPESSSDEDEKQL